MIRFGQLVQQLVLMAAFLWSASSASALEILNAQIVGAGEEAALEMNVVYGGGCKTHQFELQMDYCMESFPVQCRARLVDLTTDDFCEAMISKTVTFSLRELGLLDSYYQRASLEISASFGTPAVVRLP
ncbi:MAG TPA: hypothetical protein PLZ57_14990 [Pseudobdellovibrionaceae bacterium]|nr:hypothetical protein [Pseudobdellovibrionaceae bacterium]